MQGSLQSLACPCLLSWMLPLLKRAAVCSGTASPHLFLPLCGGAGREGEGFPPICIIFEHCLSKVKISISSLLGGCDRGREDSPDLAPPPDVEDNRQCALCLKYGDDGTNVSGFGRRWPLAGSGQPSGSLWALASAVPPKSCAGSCLPTHPAFGSVSQALGSWLHSECF